MGPQRFDIVIYQFSQDGVEGLQRMFGLGEDQARAFVSRLPARVKKDVLGDELKVFTSALRDIGAELQVRPASAGSTLVGGQWAEAPLELNPPASSPARKASTMGDGWAAMGSPAAGAKAEAHQVEKASAAELATTMLAQRAPVVATARRPRPMSDPTINEGSPEAKAQQPPAQAAPAAAAVAMPEPAGAPAVKASAQSGTRSTEAAQVARQTEQPSHTDDDDDDMAAMWANHSNQPSHTRPRPRAEALRVPSQPISTKPVSTKPAEPKADGWHKISGARPVPGAQQAQVAEQPAAAAPTAETADTVEAASNPMEAGDAQLPLPPAQPRELEAPNAGEVKPRRKSLWSSMISSLSGKVKPKPKPASDHGGVFFSGDGLDPLGLKPDKYGDMQADVDLEPNVPKSAEALAEMKARDHDLLRRMLPKAASADAGQPAKFHVGALGPRSEEYEMSKDNRRIIEKSGTRRISLVGRVTAALVLYIGLASTVQFVRGNPAEDYAEDWKAAAKEPLRAVSRRSVASSKQTVATEGAGVAIDPTTRIPKSKPGSPAGADGLTLDGDLSPLMRKAQEAGKLPPRIE